MWRDCVEGRVVDDWQNADDAVTQRLREECSSRSDTKEPCRGDSYTPSSRVCTLLAPEHRANEGRHAQAGTIHNQSQMQEMRLRPGLQPGPR